MKSALYSHLSICRVLAFFSGARPFSSVTVPLMLLLSVTPAWAPTEPSRPELVPQTGHTSYVSGVAFSPDGRWLASGSDDNTIKLWEVATGREVRTLAGHTAGVSGVAFSPDGRWLASGSFDLTIKLWEVATGREVRTLRAHTSSVTTVAFSPD